MKIKLWMRSTEPPVGDATRVDLSAGADGHTTTVGDRTVPFVGWLELIRVVSELLVGADPAAAAGAEKEDRPQE